MKCCLDRRLIGEILVERGLITDQQLGEALRLQRSSATGAYLGEVLIGLGYVSEIDIVTALVVQCNLPYIAVSRYEISQDILQLIPAEFARRNKLIPLDRIGCVMSVVMHNPLNEDVRREVEGMTGCKVATFISMKSEIEGALVRYYSAA